MQCNVIASGWWADHAPIALLTWGKGASAGKFLEMLFYSCLHLYQDFGDLQQEIYPWHGSRPKMWPPAAVVAHCIRKKQHWALLHSTLHPSQLDHLPTSISQSSFCPSPGWKYFPQAGKIRLHGKALPVLLCVSDLLVIIPENQQHKGTGIFVSPSFLRALKSELPEAGWLGYSA